MKKAILLLLVIFSTNSFAEKKYLLEGTIGKSPIYMFFEDNSSLDDKTIYNVRYFYKNSLKDIVLSGEKVGNKFIFQFESDNKIKEKFELYLLENTVFEGFWIDEKGLKLAVKLSAFDKYKNALKTNLFSENSFDFLKTSLLQFKLDSTSMYKGKTIEWFSEMHCKAHFFRLGKGFTEAVKKKINPILNQYHSQNVLAQLSCSSSFYYNEGEAIEYSITINYLDNNLIGYYDFSTYYCGGAHPDFGGIGNLLDLKSGKSYTLDEIIAFDKSVTVENKNNFTAFSKYRSNYFAPKLFSLVNKTQHFEKPTSEDDYCDYTNLEYWDFPSWNFTKKGIEFTPSFFRAARSCEEPFLVSFADLRKFKNKNFSHKF